MSRRIYPAGTDNWHRSCPGCGVERTSYEYHAPDDLVTMRYPCGTVQQFRGHGWGSRIHQGEQCKRNNPKRRFDEHHWLGPVTP